MSRKIKRALSLVIVFTLIFSLMTLSASAAVTMTLESSGTVTLDGVNDGTVTVTAKTGNAISGAWTLEAYFSPKGYDDSDCTIANSYFTLSSISGNAFEAESTNLVDGQIIFTDSVNLTGFSVAEGGDVCSATYTVDKDTPAGTYYVSFHMESMFDSSYSEQVGADSDFIAAIKVERASTAEGYTVDLSASPTSVQAGGTVDVTLAVTGTENTFNAFYAQLSYDSNFTFVEESSYANGFAVAKDAKDTVLTITRTGESLTAIDTGTALTLHFTAEDVTAVTEVSAAFTLNVPKVDKAANADSQNAPEAAITGSPAAVTINPIATYTVTYNANGATGGAVPADSNSYVANAEVTVLGNTGSLVKTGYTFDGWNTSADGEGTAYAAGDTFAITENTTLYAQWTADTYTVTLYDNGADTCGALTSYTYGVGATLPTPTKAGYTFDGWYENASFSGTPVTEISATDTGEKVFYAKWTANTTVTVSAYCDGFTLIKVTGTLEAGKTFAYDSNAMYSDGNGNYYYVVAGTAGIDITEDGAKAKVSQIAGSSTALTIDRDGDANQTGTVDINDAQFIYNLHSGYYKTSGTTVSVDKLLEADVNGNGVVDTADVAAAVAAIQ